MSSEYGGLNRNIWFIIVNFIPESDWKHIKCLNKKFSLLFDSKLLIKNKSLKDLCLDGDVHSLCDLLNNNENIRYHTALYYACIQGDIDPINLILSKVPRNYSTKKYSDMYGWDELDISLGYNIWVSCLYGAIQAGHLKIIDMMFEKCKITIKDEKFRDADASIKLAHFHAYMNGNDQLINYVDQKFSYRKLFHQNRCGGIEFYEMLKDKEALSGACLGGHKHLVNSIIKSRNPRSLNQALMFACLGGHKEIIDLLIEKGAKNWNLALRGAIQGDHIEIIELMLEKPNIDDPLALSCLCPHLKIIESMINKGYNNFNYGLYHACYSGYIENVKYMIEKGANNWDFGLIGAIKGSNIEIMKIMLDKGTISLNKALYEAYICESKEIIDFLISIGANY